MIISASRRTDIPSYFSEWFINRIIEKYVVVSNPVNKHQLSRIYLSPEVVDGIVFWTKNPLPMMDKLDLLGGYTYYFQFTLNSYGIDAEPNVPPKNDVIIPVFAPGGYDWPGTRDLALRPHFSERQIHNKLSY